MDLMGHDEQAGIKAAVDWLGLHKDGQMVELVRLASPMMAALLGMLRLQVPNISLQLFLCLDLLASMI